jgi:hypothetical protein
MAIAAAWAVAIYMRSQQPAWITLGAGARIGLVTGLLAGWLAFGVSGGALFIQRFVLHQSSQMDADWKSYVEASNQASLQMAQQFSSWMAAADIAKMQANQAEFYALILTPEGHAGATLFNLATYAAFLLIFAAAGGALGARLLARARQPEV